MTETVWLSRSDVETLHGIVIESSGGSHGLRDANLLESALARPQNLHAYGEADAFQLAASYAEGIARNHAFVDGNKRTAFMAAAFFLRENGQELMHRDDDGYVDLMEMLAQGQTSREHTAEYFKANARPSQQRRETQEEQTPALPPEGKVAWVEKYRAAAEQKADTPQPKPRGPRMKP